MLITQVRKQKWYYSLEVNFRYFLPISKEDNIYRDEHVKNRFAAAMLLLFSMPITINADDTDLFVAELPSDAQSNVIFVMDTSGSMGASVGNSTRIAVAKSAARSFIENARNINIGLMSFQGNSGGTVDKAVETVDTGRQSAINVVNGYIASGGTPLSETLYEGYRYLTGQARKFAVRGDSDAMSGGSYLSPITNSCQKNYIVLFTDGDPSKDEGANADIHSLLSGLTLPQGLSASCSGHGGCLDELAWYMHNQDILPSMASDQLVDTYTIAGFGSAPPALLTSTANHGGGEYFSASNASELNDALNAILLRVNSEESTFSTPVTTTNLFNSLETAEEVFYTVFRPNVGPGWTGNLKRYRLGSDNQLYDVNDVLAIDSSTGFFAETAQSFWSSSADGKVVEDGGAAEKISGNNLVSYTNISGETDVDLLDFTNLLHETYGSVTPQLLGIDVSGGVTQAITDEKNEIVQWGRGIDVDDEDSDGSTTDNRTSMGDPLHTKPLILRFYKSTGPLAGVGGIDDKSIFFTTNDGFLRAVNANTGNTHFNFIPKELLKNLKIYRDGYVEGDDIKVYGLDGPMTAWVNDINGDGDVLQANNGPAADTGEHTILYLTMRRGGNNIYALDVTHRSSPELKWVIKGDLDNDHEFDSPATNPSFGELGQTWSAANVEKILWNGSSKQVLIFGGGYDLDTDDDSTIEYNNVGRAIYIVDALTGAKLWSGERSGGDLTITDMNYSIPADVTTVDIDQNGYVDYIFAADVGGQILRLDINQTNTGAADFATGGVIANLSGTSESSARRFFEAPDVVIGKDSQYLNITIGSGFRAEPLGTEVSDRVYVIRDPNVFNSPSSYGYDSGSVITESSLYDATANLIQQGNSGQQGTALANLASAHGWMMRLETSGEKVLGRLKVFKGILLFNTFAPRSSTAVICGPQSGENFFYAVSVEDASSVFNLDGAGTTASLNKTDRKKLLQHSSLAPEPSILTRGSGGAEICVGTECFQDTLQSLGSVPVNRNFWKENR